MQIQSLTLPTRHLSAQHAFYTRTLGFSIESETSDRVTLYAGATLLTFRQDEAFDGCSHVAFDIPRNQIGEAQDWLLDRVALLADEKGLACFPLQGAWNSTSLYFEDADANILEFIARHDLANDRQEMFGAQSVCHVSELGVVVPDVLSAVHRLGERFGLHPFIDLSDTFTPVGGHDGMLIVVRAGRGWFPVGRPATPTPFEIQFSHEGRSTGLRHTDLLEPA